MLVDPEGHVATRGQRVVRRLTRGVGPKQRERGRAELERELAHQLNAEQRHDARAYGVGELDALRGRVPSVTVTVRRCVPRASSICT